MGTSKERRAMRAEARARVARLRGELRTALAAKKQRMRELTKIIRAERVALRDRLREVRKTRLAELRDWERGERAKARAEWRRRRDEAKGEDEGELARARAELAADRAHAAEVRRIAREARQRAVSHAKGAQNDEDVRALVPSELVPLFDRVKQSIRGTPKQSRAEAFLQLAAARPDDVFRIVEPRLEQAIEEVLAALKHAERGSTVVCGGAHRVKAANGNAPTGGGPNPAEVARLRALAERPSVAVKGEGLDTTAIAKRIREDIKAAIKARELPKAKYSVRTDKYSMGSSITVEASSLPFPVLNPDAYRVEPGAKWVTFDSANHRSRFTPKAQEVERKLSAIVNSYHWDRSDSMTDLYNERFAKDVRLTENKGDWQKLEAAKVAAARAAEGRE
jgi:hypothetical protein